MTEHPEAPTTQRDTEALNAPFRAVLVSVFPDFLHTLIAMGVVGRALDSGLLALDIINPRDHASGRYRRVDDAPFGGGAGMVLKPEVMTSAVGAARALAPGAPVIALTAQGKRFDQAMARELAANPGMILVCGRYEGFDQRFLDREVEAEVSLGDFVLSGGEVAAAVVADAVLRLLPGVLGNADSALEESFSGAFLEHPQYTRPAEYAGDAVPEVLLSGDHARIADARRQASLGRTWMLRPDLLESSALSPRDRALLDDFIRAFLARRKAFGTGGLSE